VAVRLCQAAECYHGAETALLCVVTAVTAFSMILYGGLQHKGLPHGPAAPEPHFGWAEERWDQTSRSGELLCMGTSRALLEKTNFYTI